MMKRNFANYLLISGMLTGMAVTSVNISSIPTKVYAQEVVSEQTGVLQEEKTQGNTVQGRITYRLDAQGVLHIYNPDNAVFGVDTNNNMAKMLEEDGVDLTLVKEIKFENKLPVENMSYMFFNMENLEKVNFDMLADGKEYGDNGVTKYKTIFDLGRAFYNCKSLKNIDLSSLNFEITDRTSASNMEYAFYNCISLTEVNFKDTHPASYIRSDYSKMETGNKNHHVVDCDKEYKKEQYFYEWTVPAVKIEQTSNSSISVAGKKAVKSPKEFGISPDSGSYVYFTIEDGIVNMPTSTNVHDDAGNALTIKGYKFKWDDNEYFSLSENDKKLFMSFDAKYILDKCVVYDKTLDRYTDVIPSFKTYYNERTYSNENLEETIITDNEEILKSFEPSQPIIDKPIVEEPVVEDPISTPTPSTDAPAVETKEEKVTVAPTETTGTSTTTNNPSSQGGDVTNQQATTTVVTDAPQGVVVSLNTVKDLKTAKGRKQVTYTWKKVANAKGYQLQIAKNKKMTKSLKDYEVSGTKKSFKRKKGTYYIRVRAVSGDVTSKWTKVKKVKIK